jgi:Phage integrase, N-terminal SAM-like domain
MSADPSELRVEPIGGGYTLVGPAPAVDVINEFLGYLVDRNYSCQTVRAYAYDLLHFTRWLSGEQLVLEAVDIDVLLRYLSWTTVVSGWSRPSIVPLQLDVYARIAL